MLKQQETGVVVATLMIVAVILTGCSSANDETGSGDSGVTTPSGAATEMPAGPSDTTDPERHTFTTYDPALDGSYEITMKLLDGYGGDPGDQVVFGSDGGQGISTWTVGNVYAKPCRSTLLDPPIDSSVDALIAGLASQRGRHATTPTDVQVDGYVGKYIEMTVPPSINVADCAHGEYRTWTDPTEGNRYLEAGQRDLLWILDVDGARLVIDAALGPKTTEQDREDRIQMVKSIQIDPV